jgi:hypothetical protein
MSWESGCGVRALKGSKRTLTQPAQPLDFEALRRICRTCGKCRIQRKQFRRNRGTIKGVRGVASSLA